MSSWITSDEALARMRSFAPVEWDSPGVRLVHRPTAWPSSCARRFTNLSIGRYSSFSVLYSGITMNISLLSGSEGKFAVTVYASDSSCTIGRKYTFTCADGSLSFTLKNNSSTL